MRDGLVPRRFNVHIRNKFRGIGSVEIIVSPRPNDEIDDNSDRYLLKLQSGCRNYEASRKESLQASDLWL